MILSFLLIFFSLTMVFITSRLIPKKWIFFGWSHKKFSIFSVLLWGFWGLLFLNTLIILSTYPHFINHPPFLEFILNFSILLFVAIFYLAWTPVNSKQILKSIIFRTALIASAFMFEVLIILQALTNYER